MDNKEKKAIAKKEREAEKARKEKEERRLLEKGKMIGHSSKKPSTPEVEIPKSIFALFLGATFARLSTYRLQVDSFPTTEGIMSSFTIACL